MKKLLLLMIMLTMVTIVGAQTTLVLQPDAAAGKDAEVWDLHPDSTISYTGDVDFIAAHWTWGGFWGVLRSFVQFDLSSIPTGAVVDSAILSLYYNPTSSSNGQAGSNASYLQRVTSAWTENTVTWNNQPTTDTTYQVLLAQSTLSNQDYPNINVTAATQYMVANQSTNFGWMIKLADETTQFASMKFSSSDQTTPAYHPTLTIVYHDGGCFETQPASATGKDAEIWDLYPDSTISYTGDVDFIAAHWTWGGFWGLLRSMVQFDLSTIPTTANVSTAELSLYYNPTSSSNGQAGNNESSLQRITSPWVESTVTWNTQPTTDTTYQCTLPQSTTINQDYPNIDVKPSVQYMVANPTTNYGWMIKLTDELGTFASMKFSSSDQATQSFHPKLRVCYTDDNCVEMQPDAATGKDSEVWSLYPDSTISYTGDVDFIAAYWTWGGFWGVLRSMIQFDMTSIPTSAIVNSAELSLYYNPTSSSNGQAGTNESYLQRITAPWVESTVTWNNQPTTDTVNQVTLARSTSANQDYPNIDVSASTQLMVSNPALNFGWMIKLINESAQFSSMKFSSSDQATQSFHPKLRVCYTDPKSSAVHEVIFELGKTIAYPNPFTNSLIIEAAFSTPSPVKISAVDLKGTNIFSENIQNKVSGTREFDLSNEFKNAPSGVYFVQLQSQKEVVTKKVVKN